MTLIQHPAFIFDSPALSINPASIFDLGPQHTIDETDVSPTNKTLDIDLHDTFAQMMIDPAIAAARQKTRDQRLRQCGTRCKRRFDSQSGKLRAVIYWCDMWRGQLCPVCFGNRKEYLLGRAHSAVIDARKENNKHLIRKAEISKKDGNKLARKLPKDDYIRLPVDDDLDLFLIDSDDFDGGEEITYDEISELNWDKLTDTAKGRNVSGHLGKPKDADDDDVELISVESVVLHSDTTREQERIALEAVAEKTGDLDPKTAKEVEKAIAKRTKVYIATLKKAGGKILGTRIIKIKCRTSCIAWKRYTEKTALEQAEGGSGIPF